jgi:hypothetical protein
MTKHSDIDEESSELPEDLAVGAEQLRALEVPDDFEQRLRHRLADADRGRAIEAQRPPARWPRLLVFVPSLAALAIALHVMVAPSTDEEVARFEERHVVLEHGNFVDLDLWVHHHDDDEDALVHVDVPASVSLHAGDPARDLLPSSCEADRCVHRFVHDDDVHTPLRVRIQQPGRYDIHVEHRSPNTRVREHFVVHAR